MPLDPQKITAAMAAKNISRADLSRLLRVKPPNVTRLLSGEQGDQKLSTVERLAKALGCRVDKLLADERQ